MNLTYESKIKLKSDFTVQYLKLCDFKWPLIKDNYIKFILNLLEGE